MNIVHKRMGGASIISASVRGADHIVAGKPCQDALSIKEGAHSSEPYLMIAMADGHGHESVPHSDRGASLATLAAEQCAMQFILKIAGKRKKRLRQFKELVKEHLRNLWMENIRLARQSYRVDEPTAYEHGTTVLLTVWHRGGLYTAQLGDGDICVMDKAGTMLTEHAMPPGPSSSAVYSLSSNHTKAPWKFRRYDSKDVDFIMVSTDGLFNAMDDEGAYLRLSRTLNHYLKTHPAEDINRQLPHWLSAYSKKGSGDDISLVAISPNTPNQEET